MSQPILSIQFETKELEAKLVSLLKFVRTPKNLMTLLQRFIHALTMKMFNGPRPDKRSVRGVKWQPLAESTLWAKRESRKRGYSIAADRPLVRSGMMMDTLKVLQKKERGFTYGTLWRSPKGYPYPAIHNLGGTVPGRPPQRMWLFISKFEYMQMVKMTVDLLRGYLKFIKLYGNVKGDIYGAEYDRRGSIFG
jgi:phage gpG-like protein